MSEMFNDIAFYAIDAHRNSESMANLLKIISNVFEASNVKITTSSIVHKSSVNTIYLPIHDKNINYMLNIIDPKKKVNDEEIKKKNIVIFPTETVYGIGADCTDSNAVEKIFIAKGRPNNNPLIVHLSDIDKIKDYAIIENDIERKLNICSQKLTQLRIVLWLLELRGLKYIIQNSIMFHSFH